jgi:hypothetical protein
MPPYLIRHFIRGCWDGDDSVYLNEKDLRRPGASFISGSKDFIEQLVRNLVDLGLPNRTIHIRNTAKRGTNRAYYFPFNGRDCVLLYHVLYDNVDESVRLSRKHDRFKAIADYYERQVSHTQHIVPIQRPVTSLSVQIARANVSLRRGAKNWTTMQLRAQQMKAASGARRKELETFTGTKSPSRKAEGDLAPNFERAGVNEKEDRP